MRTTPAEVLSTRAAVRRGTRTLSLATLAVAMAGAAVLAQAADTPPGPGGPMMGGPGGDGPHRAMMMRPGMPGPGGMPGLFNPRMLDSIGASAEQKTRLHEIMRAAHEESRKQHGAQRDLHQQLAATLAAPQVDAAAAEALRQKLQAGHDAASKRMLQAMLDASAVLTPEQRQKLHEQMGQRREMIERHRRERDALDGRRS